MVDGDMVNDLVALLNDDIEQIVDDAGVPTVTLDLKGDGRVHIHHGHLDALALLGAELLEELVHRRAISIGGNPENALANLVHDGGRIARSCAVRTRPCQ